MFRISYFGFTASPRLGFLMCLGVPGLVVERQNESDGLDYGIVEFAGIRRRVSLACVPEAQMGDYVIVHAGIAISCIDPVEAQRVFSYLNEIAEENDWTAGEHENLENEGASG